ncbi:phosphoribosylglycinamide formyltransferase [Dechloromonas agitata]|uniref:Phosphoribosylglycinamide formyltransferase n=1 Tax=Dechloromonas agitata TaxID=73030 RepID=A0A930BTA4_9RHOO|nr:phosphoribosylglycinamide formyltransferase [Dechloromonas agitata]MBF1165668.1 phosphoribosylglycinamide formyltransferase [Dechloromonas agitata]MDE1545540.1 phosphoribosylglycinamide formyltransferase [Dechloromonas agitata]
MKNIVILISGRGSNMEALIAARDAGNLPVNIAAVISNRPDAAGLETAAKAGIVTHYIDHKAFAGREAFDAALAECIDGFAPDLVVLAGFMRILSEGFVRRYAGRLMNIHPSLLPSFPGLHTHQRALDEGVRIHGCTVHFVTPSLDHGPVIIQAAVPVLDSDDEASLAARVLRQEHRVYPQAVRWFAEGKLTLDNGRVRLAADLVSDSAFISPVLR